jgi:hypothetical protein
MVHGICVSRVVRVNVKGEGGWRGSWFLTGQVEFTLIPEGAGLGGFIQGYLHKDPLALDMQLKP